MKLKLWLGNAFWPPPGVQTLLKDRPKPCSSSDVNPVVEKRPRRVSLSLGIPLGSDRVPSSNPSQSRLPPGKSAKSLKVVVLPKLVPVAELENGTAGKVHRAHLHQASGELPRLVGGIGLLGADVLHQRGGKEVHGDHFLVRTGGGDHGAVEHGGAVALPLAADVDVLAVHDGDPGDPLHHVAGVGTDHPGHLLRADGIAHGGGRLPFHQQGGFGGLVGLGHHGDLAQIHAAQRIQGHVLEGRLSHGHINSADDLGDVNPPSGPPARRFRRGCPYGRCRPGSKPPDRPRDGFETRHPVEEGSVGHVDHEARKSADARHVAGLGGFALRRG